MKTNSLLNDGAYNGRLPEVISEVEQKALLEIPNKKAPTGLRNYALMSIYLNLGLRVSEALNLEVDDVDWNSGKVVIRSGKGNRDRVLWLSDRDLGTLQQWRSKRKCKSPYLFCTLAGGQLSDRYVRAFVSRYGKKAGIKKNVYPHILRHTFATDLLRETKNIRLVQKALGHVSISTTMIYTHIVDDQLEEALRGFRG